VPTNNLISYSALRSDNLYRLLGMAVTIDLSESGLRVRTVEPLPIADELVFSVKVENTTYKARGRIVWGAEIEENRQYEFGVKFKDIDFGFAKDLWKVTERLLAETPADAHPLDGKGDVPVLVATATHERTGPDPQIVLTIQTPDPSPAFRERLPTPKPMGMVGHFEGDQLIEFVQMLGLQSKTGVVEVVTEKGDCFIAVRDGFLIAARTHDGKSAEEAVYQILALKTGAFDFWPHALAEVKAEHGFSVQSMLLEVMRRRDAPADPVGGSAPAPPEAPGGGSTQP
jgi:hypothetical protein